MTTNNPNKLGTFISSFELLGWKLGIKRTRMLCSALLLLPTMWDVSGEEQRIFKTYEMLIINPIIAAKKKKPRWTVEPHSLVTSATKMWRSKNQMQGSNKTSPQIVL